MVVVVVVVVQETDLPTKGGREVIIGSTIGAPSSGLSLVGLLASIARLCFTRQHRR
jgi:hypothetical protein